MLPEAKLADHAVVSCGVFEGFNGEVEAGVQRQEPSLASISLMMAS